MEIICPVKNTRWGPVTTKAQLVSLIRTYGQFFGVDQSGPACNYNSSYPCDQSLYQYMGWGPHKGIDIPLNEGEEIFAVADGKVVRLSDSVTQGLGVVIRHSRLNLETVYWHNKENLVTFGQDVKQGDLIAKADSTGFSTGHHIHFETRNIDNLGNFVSYADPLPLISFDELMTEEEVKKQYALSFYRAPDAGELAHWTGRPLLEFLNTAIKDRAEFLNNQ